jgi:phenylpropionate dioxygenase-like ring-hydroxylating dioxygenase large terminal subunit
MMSQEQNDLITRTGAKDPCGKLMRMYWQPAALVDELAGPRPVKPVKLLGENLVLFRDDEGRYGLIERHCAHRGADLAFGRLENGGLRCAFHGWLFDATGQCLETPAEPKDSPLCKGIRQRAYPVVEKSGILWAYLGEGEPPAFPEIDCFVAPDSHTTGCRRSKSASIRRTPRSCIASSRTRIPRAPTASSSAARRPAPTCR